MVLKADSKQQIIQVLAKSLQLLIEQEKISFDELQEIRMRIGQPLIFVYQNHEQCTGYLVTKAILQETIEYISHYSLYAFEQELKQGFITIEGGHRVGISGKVIIEGGRVKNIQYISSMNIRISHEILGCADALIPYVTANGKLLHTLIISPPKCGKTTMIRDMIRQISDGNRYLNGCTVGVVDERSELCGCYMGVPQNDMGMRTDILDCCPKAEGMMMLIRSMSPQVIAVDEIGTPEEVRSVEYAMHCGCKLLASVHGCSLEEIRMRPAVEQLVRQQRFERYVVLANQPSAGTIQAVFDAQGAMIFGIK